MMESSKIKIIAIYALVFLGILFALPNIMPQKALENLPFFLPKQKINLGLDLRGGSQLLLEVEEETYLKEQKISLMNEIKKMLRQEKIVITALKITGDAITLGLKNPQESSDVKSMIRKLSSFLNFSDKGGFIIINFSEEFVKDAKNKVLQQSIEIIRRRVDETGTKEPVIQKQGENSILLQVPGLENPEMLKNMLGKTAKLEFRMVEDIVPEGDPKISVSAFLTLPMEKEAKNGQQYYYLLKKNVELGGDALVDAQATFQNGQPVVSFRLDSFGGKIFADLTRANSGKMLAIVLDNRVLSAPFVNEPILTGSGVISGNFTAESANELAVLLRAGALPAPIKVIEERTVGPSLGQDSIDSGIAAAVLGIAMVIIFMIATYLKFGLFANLALIINMIFLVAALSILQATLTMPGIAGIVLTMGMSVDANVLIFERIREEIKHGLSNFAAVDHGFNNAFRAIMDSNITTLIVALILYIFGTGAVRGFAVTVSIGIISSMVTAITITKMMILWWLRSSKKPIIKL